MILNRLDCCPRTAATAKQLFCKAKNLGKKRVERGKAMNRVRSAVKAVIQNKNRFLILKQKIGSNEFWDLPGGKVEYGENPLEALHREVKEETGLEIKIKKPLGLFWFFRTLDKDQVVCSTFLCKPSSTRINLGKNPADETIVEFQWVAPKEFKNPHFQVAHKSLKELVKKIELK